MKILITSHLFPNRACPMGGSFVWEQVRFLQKWETMEVIAPVPWFPRVRGFGRWGRFRDIPQRERIDGISVYHPRYITFPKKWLFSWVGFFYSWMLFRNARKLDFDLVHAHVAYPDGFGAVLFGRIVGVPVLITAHGSEIHSYTKRSRLWKALTAWALCRADRTIAVSRSLKEEIVALGVDSSKVSVIHNGVDTQCFRPLLEVEAGIGQEKRAKRILYLGRLLHTKGIGVLLEAMSLLLERGVSCELVLVGANAKQSEDRSFFSMAECLGRRDVVHFEETVPHAEIPRWLATADVFVLPSFSEGFPLSVIEALACGKPVVSTRCGGPEESVSEEVGILVPPGDSQALADAIGYILRHPETYDADRIRAYACRRFSLEAQCKRIARLYVSLKQNKRKRTAEPV
ncbi:MAG: glycosyltransferase family 4 protein [Candidatus Latescibacterota bacterium]